MLQLKIDDLELFFQKRLVNLSKSFHERCLSFLSYKMSDWLK